MESINELRKEYQAYIDAVEQGGADLNQINKELSDLITSIHLSSISL